MGGVASRPICGGCASRRRPAGGQRWPGSRGGAQRAMRARPDSTETLRGLRLPALVIGGEEDEIAPPPVVRAMGALILNAQVEIVPGAGHVVPLERPADTTRALAAFLGRLAAGGALPRRGAPG